MLRRKLLKLQSLLFGTQDAKETDVNDEFKLRELWLLHIRIPQHQDTPKVISSTTQLLAHPT